VSSGEHLYSNQIGLNVESSLALPPIDATWPRLAAPEVPTRLEIETTLLEAKG